MDHTTVSYAEGVYDWVMIRVVPYNTLIRLTDIDPTLVGLYHYFDKFLVFVRVFMAKLCYSMAKMTLA